MWCFILKRCQRNAEISDDYTRGDNASVVAKGNFDDAQTGVKEIFTDKEFNEMLYRKATGCLLQTPSTGEDYCLKSSIISTLCSLVGRM